MKNLFILLLLLFPLTFSCTNNSDEESDNDNEDSTEPLAGSPEAETVNRTAGEGYSGSGTSISYTPSNTSASSSPKYGYKFGMNLDFMAPWATQIMFVDVFKRSKYWDAHQLRSDDYLTKLSSIGLELTDDGYPAVDIPFDHDNDASTPGYIIHTVLFFGIGDNFPAGDYTLKFKGTGKVRVQWDAGENPEKGYDSKARHYESSGEEVTATVPVKPNIGVSIQIDESKASDPIRDIQFILPTFADSETTNTYHPFYPPFILGLNDFEVIRVMQLQGINELECDNKSHIPSKPSEYKKCQVDWDNRVKKSHFTQTEAGRGAAWEYTIDLVNKVEGADIWVNIPHAATDNYIKKLAEMLLANLEEDRKIYLEWSNEVWNQSSSFPQHIWYEENGKETFPQDSTHDAAGKYFVKGLLNIFNIFEEVFNEDPDRLVRVLNSQGGYTKRTEDLLSYLEIEAVNPGLENPIDALAISTYFGFSLLPKTNGKYISPSVDTLLANAKKYIETSVGKSVKEAVEAVDDYRTRNDITKEIKVIAYEGGSHMTPMSEDWEYLGLGNDHDQINWSSYTEANTHPDMYDVYIAWAKEWFDNGGDLIMAFSYVSLSPGLYKNKAGETIHAGTGIFGHLEHLNQDIEKAPKYRALKDLMK